MAETKDWDWRVHAVTADGYFKLAIKKHIHELIWSFAVEWNESYRIVGYFGDTGGLIDLRDRLPELAIQTIHAKGDHVVRHRREVPLSNEDDTLFDPPLDEVNGAFDGE